MTEEQRKLFIEGYNTPKDKLLDGDVGQFNRDVRELSHLSSGVKVIPTSDAFRRNYVHIKGFKGYIEPIAVWEEKG
jgi:hypothetical protein